MTRNAQERIPVFTLGERIRKVREDMGLDQKEFAGRVEVHRRSIVNWEGGRTTPRLKDLADVAKVGGVSLAWLAGEVYPEARVTASISRSRKRSTGEFMGTHRRRTSPFVPACTRAAAA